jgi:hypothetical protein
MSGQVAQVVERQPLDHEVRDSHPSRDTMALLLRETLWISPVWDNKGKKYYIIIMLTVFLGVMLSISSL